MYFLHASNSFFLEAFHSNSMNAKLLHAFQLEFAYTFALDEIWMLFGFEAWLAILESSILIGEQTRNFNFNFLMCTFVCPKRHLSYEINFGTVLMIVAYTPKFIQTLCIAKANKNWVWFPQEKHVKD